MKIEIALRTLFVSVLLGIVLLFCDWFKGKYEEKPKIPQTKLSVQLQQTKERYQEWEKEQAIKDTITELRVKMGEIQESFEDWHARSRRDLDRFVKRQEMGN